MSLYDLITVIGPFDSLDIYMCNLPKSIAYTMFETNSD